MAPIAPKPKRIRVVNQEKQASKAVKAKNAIDGKSNARKKQEEETKRAALIGEKIAKLEELSDEKKTEDVKNQIQLLQRDNRETNAKITAAKAEEEAFDKDYSNAEMEDVHDEISDPDAPKESIESRPPSPTVNVDLAALLA